MEKSTNFENSISHAPAQNPAEFLKLYTTDENAAWDMLQQINKIMGRRDRRILASAILEEAKTMKLKLPYRYKETLLNMIDIKRKVRRSAALQEYRFRDADERYIKDCKKTILAALAIDRSQNNPSLPDTRRTLERINKFSADDPSLMQSLMRRLYADALKTLISLSENKVDQAYFALIKQNLKHAPDLDYAESIITYASSRKDKEENLVNEIKNKLIAVLRKKLFKKRLFYAEVAQLQKKHGTVPVIKAVKSLILKNKQTYESHFNEQSQLISSGKQADLNELRPILSYMQKINNETLMLEAILKKLIA